MGAQGGPDDPKAAQTGIDAAVAALVMGEQPAPDGANQYSALSNEDPEDLDMEEAAEK